VWPGATIDVVAEQLLKSFPETFLPVAGSFRVRVRVLRHKFPDRFRFGCSECAQECVPLNRSKERRDVPVPYDPVCLVDLLLGAVYVTAVLVLIHRHRWMWVCYLALGGLHVAAALVQGGVHP